MHTRRLVEPHVHLCGDESIPGRSIHFLSTSGGDWLLLHDEPHPGSNNRFILLAAGKVYQVIEKGEVESRMVGATVTSHVANQDWEQRRQSQR